MSSIRLNSRHRDRIRQKLMEGKFDERIAELKELEHELAHDAYRAALGDDYEAVQKAPRYWFQCRSCVRAELGGEYVQLSFGETERGDDIQHPVPAYFGYTMYKCSGSHIFSERWNQIKRGREKIDQEKRELAAEIDAITHSVTTAKKLCEVWPEITDVVEAIVNEQVVNLPTVNTDLLNSKLGLKAG